jgi:hypothetical protein
MVTNVLGRTTVAGAVVGKGNKFNERLTQRRLAHPNGRDVVAALGVMTGMTAVGTTSGVGFSCVTDGMGALESATGGTAGVESATGGTVGVESATGGTAGVESATGGTVGVESATGGTVGVESATGGTIGVESATGGTIGVESATGGTAGVEGAAAEVAGPMLTPRLALNDMLMSDVLGVGVAMFVAGGIIDVA